MAGASILPAAFDAARAPRKLNLGCGWDYREGFVNIDLHAWHKPDVISDVRRLAWLPAGHFDEVIAHDVLEHLPRDQTGPVLDHWNRVMEPKGTISIRVPNVLAIADLLRRRENAGFERQKELMHFLFGTQAYSGDFHLTSFTEALLEQYLGASGFKVKRMAPFMEWMLEVSAQKVDHRDGAEVSDFRELLDGQGDDEAFVRRCYREILGRDADPQGFASFAAYLSGGGARQGVVQMMVNSEEHAERRRAGFA